ncbi:MAG TPA: molybdate ABC transporter substrate-binding protein [Chloroflexota bacterium]|nr:molybdate ABC transporter substrate-binding protein [Chloroflexota bacterium]
MKPSLPLDMRRRAVREIAGDRTLGLPQGQSMGYEEDLGAATRTRRSALALPFAAFAAGAVMPSLAGCGASLSSGGSGPQPTPEPRELVLMVAASLTDAFAAMGDDSPRQPGLAGIKLVLNAGASSQLRAQLEQGAPADLYASADTVQMEQAVRAGLIQGIPRIFARNRLVVIVSKENRARVASPADLVKPGLRLVTTPKEVPIGAYTRQALEKMASDPQYGAGFDRKVLANVVSEEANVRQVVTKVHLGEADAGIVYASDVITKVDVQTIPIPDRFNVVAEYPIGVVRSAKAPALARRFIEYLLSTPGQSVLEKHNFIPVH